jgi:hypothetical protein
MDRTGRTIRVWPVALVLAAMLQGCGHDRQVVSTSEGDYTMVLQVPDPTAQVGDRVPVVIRVARTDNSYLQRGLLGTVTLTASAHGVIDASSLSFRVDDDSTREYLVHAVFTASRSGVAEVRATFLDASAMVNILVAEGGF